MSPMGDCHSSVMALRKNLSLINCDRYARLLYYRDFSSNLFITEVNMSKRRNPKKEKAQRNLAYARKFRKRTNPNGSRFNTKMRRSRPDMAEDTDESAEEV
jgi:hypothetical protein